MTAPIVERLHSNRNSYLLPARVDRDIGTAAATITELLAALERIEAVVHSAGARNLMNGVQLGQVSWLIKMNDALEMTMAAIAKAKGGVA